MRRTYYHTQEKTSSLLFHLPMNNNFVDSVNGLAPIVNTNSVIDYDLYLGQNVGKFYGAHLEYSHDDLMKKIMDAINDNGIRITFLANWHNRDWGAPFCTCVNDIGDTLSIRNDIYGFQVCGRLFFEAFFKNNAGVNTGLPAHQWIKFNVTMLPNRYMAQITDMDDNYITGVAESSTPLITKINRFLVGSCQWGALRSWGGVLSDFKIEKI